MKHTQMHGVGIFGGGTLIECNRKCWLTTFQVFFPLSGNLENASRGVRERFAWGQSERFAWAERFAWGQTRDSGLRRTASSHQYASLSEDLEKSERKCHDCHDCNTKMQFTMSSLVVTDGVDCSRMKDTTDVLPMG